AAPESRGPHADLRQRVDAALTAPAKPSRIGSPMRKCLAVPRHAGPSGPGLGEDCGRRAQAHLERRPPVGDAARRPAKLLWLLPWDQQLHALLGARLRFGPLQPPGPPTI